MNEENGGLAEKIKRTLIGKPRNLRDPSIFHKLALIPILAWIGLGADGLSSASYGPEEAFKALGTPTLFFGVTAGNMDSMVNRYTSDRKIRSDDAYTPNAEPNKRPDRAVVAYAQRCREAYAGGDGVIGGIEAS
jgi:hypothetical protein